MVLPVKMHFVRKGDRHPAGSDGTVAGAAPGFVAGVPQINVRVPAGLTGSQPLQVRVGEAVSPASTIAVR